MLSESDKAARKNRVTASNLAAFLGFHWYSSPSQAWDYHTGRVKFLRNKNVRLGELMEPGIVKFATEELQWNEYIYPCGTRISKEIPWAAATPDCLTVAGNLGIQAKNQNGHMIKGYKGKPGDYGKSDNDLLPPYMLAQCQWEMLVHGANRWYFAVYFGGDNHRTYSIWRDQDMIDRFIDRAYPFWKQHLDPDGPQTRPSDKNWNPNIDRPGRKLRGKELIDAPIMRPT